MPTLLCINGSLRGAQGNTAHLLEAAAGHAAGHTVRHVVLAEYRDTAEALLEQVAGADAFLVGSGVYWGSYGSPLQRFIEVMTAYETTPAFFGKPAGAVLSMDSVGGTDVAARLLGVLNLFGCAVPPLGCVVLSRLGHAPSAAGARTRDVWGADDLRVLVGNLLRAAAAPVPWERWEVHPTAPVTGPYPAAGPLHIDAPAWVMGSER
jgi:NAD(P)H-dependent FMN reductase